MPRHRRNRKRKARVRQQTHTMGIDESSQTEIDVVRACADNSSLKSNDLTPFRVTTPHRTPPPLMGDDLGEPLLKMTHTPVNPNRRLPRKPRKSSSFNVTNLNILFDSNFVYNESGHQTPVVNQQTQTPPKIAQTNIETQVEDDIIVETPRMSQLFLLEANIISSAEKNVDINLNEKPCNVNPYLNGRGVECDVSYFAPKFKQHISSTPIDTVESRQIVEDLKEAFKDSTPPKRISPAKISPKSRSRLYSRTHSYTYSRVSLSRKTSNDKGNVCDKLYMKLKRYSKVSAQWSLKVVDVCSQLGISLKNSLSTLCTNPYPDDTPTSGCKCMEYKQEIDVLNKKIVDLSHELIFVKGRLEERKENNEGFDKLTDSLKKVKDELTQITDLRTELEALKEQFGCLKSAPSVVITTAPTAAPPPPPPPPIPRFAPPPPPPPPPPLLLPLTSLKITRKSKSDETTTGKNKDSRPVISLDDILKVKLKKTSERPTSTPLRRTSQPVVSLDMLRQVRLRPARRTSLHADSHSQSDTENSSSLTTSPHSSLTRLLNDNPPVWKVKRLKNTSRYSLDSVHRKNVTGSRRERDTNSSTCS